MMALHSLYFGSTILFFISSINCSPICKPNAPHPDYEVQFLSVLFRHGDRVPTEFYPNDPNTLNDFYPAGLGQLTAAGKARQYQLGTELRHLYKDFLGETYMPYMVKARSTDVDRTKMSLLVVLGALYPPRGKQIWNPTLNWQPIPYSYVPREEDIMMAPDKSSVKYLDELERVRELEEVKVKVEKFRCLMKDLTRWTGAEIHSTTRISRLLHTLMAESSMGLTLPEWARDDVIRQQMLDATVLEYQITNYNIYLRKLHGGILLRNIIDTMRGIATQKITDGRKIQLFSGHESTLVALLSAIGVFKPHVPEFSSSIIVELLRDHSSEYYVHIRYYLGTSPRTITLEVPGCTINPCPLREFTELMKDVISIDDDMITVSKEHHSGHIINS